MVTGPLADNTLRLLDEAIAQWVRRGYAFVNLPWIVPVRYSAATRPAEIRDVLTSHGAFVASGEQSFLQLRSEGRLPHTTHGYVGWTPCLRDEPVLDELHQFGFVKAELYLPLNANDDGPSRLAQMLLQQQCVFRELGIRCGHREPRLAQEPVSAEQIDILCNGIEIGSYGIRTFDGAGYVYGTALALPRFTQALAQAA